MMEQAVKNLQEKYDDINEFIAAQKEKNANFNDKLKELAVSHATLISLATNLEVQGKAMEKLSADVDELKRVPSRRLDQFIYIIVAAIVGVLAGRLLG